MAQVRLPAEVRLLGMKQRLDMLLVEKGLAESRSKAQALIMAGRVKVDGTTVTKSGALTSTNSEFEVSAGAKYVSRGGDKLESAASDLGIDFQGKTVLDVGASTGGFTDYALQHGATKVVAVDVGTGQLDQKLRNDPRVVVMEKTDIRNVIARNEVTKQSERDRRASLAMTADMVLIDVSFISLTKVLPSVIRHLSSGGLIVAMAKPQFEASKKIADRHRGVIKDEAVRSEILENLEAQLAKQFEIIGSADSKVAGTKGNLERFYLLRPKSDI